MQVLNIFGEFFDHRKCDQAKRAADNSEWFHIVGVGHECLVERRFEIE
jgi:hypothetical protein